MDSLEPGFNALFDAIESNQAAICICDILALAIKPYQGKGGTGLLLSRRSELSRNPNPSTGIVKEGCKGVITIRQENII